MTETITTKWYAHRSSHVPALWYITDNETEGRGIVIAEHLMEENARFICRDRNFQVEYGQSLHKVIFGKDKGNELPPLQCPNCGNNAPFTLTVARDMKATRRCQRCGCVWLKEQDVGPSAYNPDWTAPDLPAPTREMKERMESALDGVVTDETRHANITDLPAETVDTLRKAMWSRLTVDVPLSGTEETIAKALGFKKIQNTWVLPESDVNPEWTGTDAAARYLERYGEPDPKMWAEHKVPPRKPNCTCHQTFNRPCPEHVNDDFEARRARYNAFHDDSEDDG